MNQCQSTLGLTCSQPEIYKVADEASKKTGDAIDALDKLIPTLSDDVQRYTFERYRGVMRCIQYQLMEMTCNEDLLDDFWTYAHSRNWTALRSKKQSE